MDQQFEEYLDKLSVDQKEFDSFFEFYNNEFSGYGNEVYKDIRSRLAHLKYFLENSWWNNRFHFLFKYYDKYDQIIDLGFSVPYLPIYLNNRGLLNKLPKMVYVGGNNTSKKLADIILRKLSVSAQFVTGDLENESTWSEIQKLASSDKKLFVCFETIEHFEHPEKFWENLKRYSGSSMVLSLPIGPKIPSHNSAFEDIDRIKEYLKNYLDITEEKVFSGKEFGSGYDIYTCHAFIA